MKYGWKPNSDEPYWVQGYCPECGKRGKKYLVPPLPKPIYGPWQPSGPLGSAGPSDPRWNDKWTNIEPKELHGPGK